MMDLAMIVDVSNCEMY